MIRDPPVAQVVLNRPERLNAWLTGQELEIATAFEALNEKQHEDVKVVIFRGEGRSFSSGYDVNELGTQYWESGEDTKSRPSQRRRLLVDAEGRNVLRAIFQSRKVVIGELKGYVLGGAFEFVLGCDILIAAEGTIIGSPPARMVAAAGYEQLLQHPAARTGALRRDDAARPLHQCRGRLRAASSTASCRSSCSRRRRRRRRTSRA